MTHEIKKLEQELKTLKQKHDIIIDSINKESTEELHRQNIDNIKQQTVIEDQIKALKKEYLSKPQIGMYANRRLGSDVEPFEVIKVISDKTIEIRHMETTRDESAELNFEVGGFAGTCTNQYAQRWFYNSKQDGKIERIRKRKDGSWGNGHITYDIDINPRKFYDYNY